MASDSKDFLRDYTDLCIHEGADLVLSLANALIKVENLDSGLSKNRTEYLEARLALWKDIDIQRRTLEAFIHIKLKRSLDRLKSSGASSSLASRVESDIVLRAGIAITLGRGTLSRPEAMALLASWNAPILTNS